MTVAKLEIAVASRRSIDWQARRGVELAVGSWLKGTANHPTLSNNNQYPPTALLGLSLEINGWTTMTVMGSWQLSETSLYLATDSDPSRRGVPTVAQRALILLSLLETVEFINIPGTELRDVQTALLSKLTEAEKPQWVATVKALNAPAPAKKSTEIEPIKGIGLVGSGAETEVVVLNGDKWFTSAGREVERPSMRAQW